MLWFVWGLIWVVRLAVFYALPVILLGENGFGGLATFEPSKFAFVIFCIASHFFGFKWLREIRLAAKDD